MEVTCEEVLSAEDRQACFLLRHQVFVEEQHVPSEREVDGLDEAARHFAVKKGPFIVATCRIRLSGSAAKIERVAVLKEFRRQGIGQVLMKYILQVLRRTGDIQLFKLSAQADAVPFYEKLGFKKRGAEYMDAGMPHYDMVWEVAKEG